MTVSQITKDTRVSLTVPVFGGLLLSIVGITFSFSNIYTRLALVESKQVTIEEDMKEIKSDVKELLQKVKTSPSALHKLQSSLSFF